MMAPRLAAPSALVAMAAISPMIAVAASTPVATRSHRASAILQASRTPRSIVGTRNGPTATRRTTGSSRRTSSALFSASASPIASCGQSWVAW